MQEVTGIFWSQSYDGTTWTKTEKSITINPQQIVSMVKLENTGIVDKESGETRDGDYLVNFNSIFNNQLEVSSGDYETLSAYSGGGGGSVSPKDVEDVLAKAVLSGMTLSSDQYDGPYDFVMEPKVDESTTEETEESNP